MGSVPSKRAPSATSKTSVQKICIDQNNGNVQSRNTNGVKRNSLVESVGDRIRKSAGSVNSRSTFEKEKRVQSLQSQLDNAEKRHNDADTFIKVLQRENNALELRNNELMEEIGWLKQQLGSNPVLNSIQIGNMANNQLGHFAESEKTAKQKYDREMYKVLTENLQQELREQDDRWKRHLQWEQERKLQLEDAIRTQFGDEQLNQLKAFIEANHEKKGSERKVNTSLWKHDSSRPATAATLVGHQESSSSVPLSLTSSFSSMDSQPLSRNLLPRGGRMATPQEGHDRDVQSANFGKSRTNSNYGQTNRFTASAHSTRRHHGPTAIDYKDDLEDISHLLLDDGGEIEDIGPGDASALSRSHDSGISVRKSTVESPRIRSAHPVPPRRRSRGPAMGSRQLSNVLSERVEPQNVVSNMKRTISATLPAASSRDLVRENESPESSYVSQCERRDSAVHVDNIRLDGEVGSFRNPDRISSASVLPKPRPRIRSMPVSEPQLPDDPDLPPNYSGDTDEEMENVVDDILNNSLPRRSAAMKAPSRADRPSSSNKSTRGSVSAKSHDSGYLEGPFSRK